MLRYESLISLLLFTDHTLLLLVRSLGRRYHLYRISLNWNLPAKQVPPGQPHVPLNPAISVKPIKLALSILEDLDLSTRMTDVAPQSSPQLSHLELLPLAPQSKYSQPTVPTILMILSKGPELENHGDRSVYSHLVRWELRGQHQRLHSCFDELSSKVKSTQSHTLVCLDESSRCVSTI